MKRSRMLEDIIKETILREGPIPFERFMETALYHPSLGYYASEKTDIGREGDFYTSPHLHPVFGAVLGRQIEECRTILGGPDKFTVVEQGAGKGYLALDIMDYLKEREMYERMEYIIVETNPVIADFQRRLLNDHGETCKWIRDIESLEEFNGCLISNELMDSFPVHLVLMDAGLKEVYVGTEENGFVEILREPSTPEIEKYLKDFSLSFPKGYRTEINLRTDTWIGQVSSKLTEGFIITIDYGYSAEEYYSEARDGGTLLCYYRHRTNENPYQNIGTQDITAHVNFSALKKWGESSGLKTVGYTSQGAYLVSMGIDEIITEKYLGKEDYEFEIAKIKGLIFPPGMGESHNVMAQYKGAGNVALRGFSMRNRVHML